MTTRKRAMSRPVDGLVRRKVYRGWIDPATELPKRTDERTQIVFGNTKWNEFNVRCRITVEYAENSHCG